MSRLKGIKKLAADELQEDMVRVEEGIEDKVVDAREKIKKYEEALNDLIDAQRSVYEALNDMAEEIPNLYESLNWTKKLTKNDAKKVAEIKEDLEDWKRENMYDEKLRNIVSGI
jgi:DNA-directed RNA polymerase sigma subunit (sigma70/sigma32)